MMKKVRGLTSFLLVAVLLISTVFNSSLVFAADNITVEINGQRVNFSDQQPVIVDGKTLVAVHGVFETLGYTVSWEQSTQTATLSNGVNTVIITVGKSTFTTNGNTYSLDVPAQIINGKTMLPFRAVLESIGCSVDWNGGSNTVIVSSDNFIVPVTTPQQTINIDTPVVWFATFNSQPSNVNYIWLESSGEYNLITLNSDGNPIEMDAGFFEIKSNSILFNPQWTFNGFSVIPEPSEQYTFSLALNNYGQWVPTRANYGEYKKTNSNSIPGNRVFHRASLDDVNSASSTQTQSSDTNSEKIGKPLRSLLKADVMENFWLKRNSAGGISADWTAKNYTGKEIKYYTLNFSLYNRVGDPVKDTIKDSSQASIRYTGPIKPYDGTIYSMLLADYDDIFAYAPTCSKVILDTIYLEYMDGSSETVNYGIVGMVYSDFN